MTLNEYSEDRDEIRQPLPDKYAAGRVCKSAQIVARQVTRMTDE